MIVLYCWEDLYDFLVSNYLDFSRVFYEICIVFLAFVLKDAADLFTEIAELVFALLVNFYYGLGCAVFLWINEYGTRI